MITVWSVFKYSSDDFRYKGVYRIKIKSEKVECREFQNSKLGFRFAFGEIRCGQEEL